ncbi:MAG: MFS transporter [Bacteroidales bacterium]|jgi:MFS family permease|nr:MFS transporter [Bacteroidales bacterium]
MTHGLRNLKTVRWFILILVSFTMFFGYFIADVMAPLMDMLKDEFEWSATEYGIFNSAYGWFNVFLFMLVISGMILDKFGARITGTGACILMIVGCGLKYYAVSKVFSGEILGLRTQVFTASIGFAVFALGFETAGVTVSKTVVRWFKGREIALAMGIQLALARLGTALAMATTIPLAKYFQSLSAPILLGLAALCIGLVTFLAFCVMERKTYASGVSEEKEIPFRMRDFVFIVANRGFWLISLLCVLFYSSVFPFLKYATSLMINKYNVAPEWAGNIPAILPLGTILLTPFFGNLYDKKGRGAGIMIAGSVMLVVIHFLFSLPLLNVWWFAAVLMILLGISFSLVPSAMWPAVAKIIPENRLGTAYSVIFWVQNVGLSLVPLLIGWILDKYCSAEQGATSFYDYTLPMIIFTCFGLAAVAVAVLLKREDKRKAYGLELPNISE